MKTLILFLSLITPVYAGGNPDDIEPVKPVETKKEIKKPVEPKPVKPAPKPVPKPPKTQIALGIYHNPNLMVSLWHNWIGIEGVAGTHNGGFLSLRHKIQGLTFIGSTGQVNYRSEFGDDKDNVFMLGIGYTTRYGDIMLRGFKTRDSEIVSRSHEVCYYGYPTVKREICETHTVSRVDKDNRNVVMLGFQWAL